MAIDVFYPGTVFSNHPNCLDCPFVTVDHGSKFCSQSAESCAEWGDIKWQREDMKYLEKSEHGD